MEGHGVAAPEAAYGEAGYDDFEYDEAAADWDDGEGEWVDGQWGEGEPAEVEHRRQQQRQQQRQQFQQQQQQQQRAPAEYDDAGYDDYVDGEAEEAAAEQYAEDEYAYYEGPPPPGPEDADYDDEYDEYVDGSEPTMQSDPMREGGPPLTDEQALAEELADGEEWDIGAYTAAAAAGGEPPAPPPSDHSTQTEESIARLQSGNRSMARMALQELDHEAVLNYIESLEARVTALTQQRSEEDMARIKAVVMEMEKKRGKQLLTENQQLQHTILLLRQQLQSVRRENDQIKQEADTSRTHLEMERHTKEQLEWKQREHLEERQARWNPTTQLTEERARFRSAMSKLREENRKLMDEVDNMKEEHKRIVKKTKLSTAERLRRAQWASKRMQREHQEAQQGEAEASPGGGGGKRRPAPARPSGPSTLYQSTATSRARQGAEDAPLYSPRTPPAVEEPVRPRRSAPAVPVSSERDG